MSEEIKYINDYLVVNKDERNRLLKRCRRELRKFDDFDTIAFSGNSGSLMSFPLAHKLNKEIIVVRKPRQIEMAHGCFLIEGVIPFNRKIVIVDDFVSAGKTVRYIVNTIREEDKKRNNGITTCEFVGILLYNQKFCSTSDRIKDLNIDIINFKFPGTPS
jgi:adenine/guanine phosphoribosyltransferase-like PRPP-binding protein